MDIEKLKQGKLYLYTSGTKETTKVRFVQRLPEDKLEFKIDDASCFRDTSTLLFNKEECENYISDTLAEEVLKGTQQSNMEEKQEQTPDREILRKRVWTIEVTDYKDGTSSMNRTHNGFTGFELLGLCDWIRTDIHKQMDGEKTVKEINPNG